MKIVKVTYTTKPGFAAQNIENIKAVMKDLRQLDLPGIHYTTCLGADGKTFIHTAFFKSDEDQKLLLELPAFKYFQEQLKTSNPEAAPQQEQLTFVGSSVNLFNGQA